ncbi:hypothetical protein VTN31DRAFT_4302 [Thermomyces dupontii]|uniref:uncharacterized protein n=1 Tax=Talaromyces thermophilus TaxID=28565 RepID=UPI0037437FF9
MATPCAPRGEYCSCGRRWIPNPRLTGDLRRDSTEYRKRYQERQTQLQSAQPESRFEFEEHVHSSNATLANPNGVSPPSSVLDDEDIHSSVHKISLSEFYAPKACLIQLPS